MSVRCTAPSEYVRDCRWGARALKHWNKNVDPVDDLLRLLESRDFKQLFPVMHFFVICHRGLFSVGSVWKPCLQKHPLGQHQCIALGLHSMRYLGRTKTSERIFLDNCVESCLFTEIYMRTGPSLKAAPSLPSSTWTNPSRTNTSSCATRTPLSTSSSTNISSRRVNPSTAVCL